jgi:hypothetical protein
MALLAWTGRLFDTAGFTTLHEHIVFELRLDQLNMGVISLFCQAVKSVSFAFDMRLGLQSLGPKGGQA